MLHTTSWMPLKNWCSLILLFSIFGWQRIQAQELNCNVQVISTKITTTDKVVFDGMQRAVMEFMNNRRWTNDNFDPSERIDCSILITIEQQLSVDQFTATFQVSSLRPIYGTNYTSNMLRYADEKVPFKFTQFDVLDFSENGYINELSSLLGYYAYIILAMDYDSYSLNGGTDYWQKAQRVVQNSATNGGAGWQSSGNRNNRYWFVQNYLNDRFKGLRECNYYYHRKGFDQMAENIQTGRAEVFKALKMLQPVHKVEYNVYNMRLFFTAKNDEILKLLSTADAGQKNEMIVILSELDPANANKYTDVP